MLRPSLTFQRSVGGNGAIVGGLFALIACSERPVAPTELAKPTDARLFVTKEVARSLDRNGFFNLESPSATASHVDAARARELAKAVVGTYAQFNRTYLEKQRRAAIDFAKLRVDPRVYYAESPYEQDVPRDVHPSIRKHTGPYYLVTFSDQGDPILSVAVSAYNADVDIENGRVAFPTFHGNDFRMQAVRAGDLTGMPVSPEHAARIAFQTLSARVAQTPRLVLPSNDFVPQYARWRLGLERPVNVRGRTGRSLTTSEVFVGLRGELSVPLREDGSSPAFSVPRPDAAERDPLTGRTVMLRRRPNVPVDFEPISR